MIAWRRRAQGALLCGLLMATTACGERFAGPPATRARLTVLTYNLWHGLNPKGLVRFEEQEPAGRREARLQCFFAAARALDPDVMFLQEVNPAPGLATRIARELGYDAHFIVDNAGLKIGGCGLPINMRSGQAILAKRDLRLESLGGRKLSGPFGATNRWFSFQFHEFRDAIGAAITVNGRRVGLIGVHLHHGPEADAEIQAALDGLVARGTIDAKRRAEIVATFDEASARRRRELEGAMAFARDAGIADGPLLMAGDFNASPDAPELKWMRDGLGFRSTTGPEGDARLKSWDYERNTNTHQFADFVPVNSFEPEVMKVVNQVVVTQTKRLDYIFYRDLPGFEVERSALFADEPRDGLFCSDHFGVFATFKAD